MKKGTIIGIPAGTIMLFMVLCVLCLAVFSVISLTSAMSDMRLSQKSAEMVKAHYDAEAKGFALLAAAEEMWQESQPAAAEIESALKTQIGETDYLSVFYAGAVLYVDCSMDIDGARELMIYAELSPPGEISRWSIHNWRVGNDGGEYIELDAPIPIGGAQ